MKKILFALLILLVPFMVYADTCDNGKVKIQSAISSSINGLAEETGDINFEGKTIDVNVKFYEVGDSITYDILIENNSDDDYELDSKSITSSNEHISYSLVSSDNLIKAKTSKTVQLKLEYVSEVEESEYQNGVFTDNKKLSINLSNNQPQNNPFTQANYITIALVILLLFQLGAYFLWNKKQIKGKALLLFITLMMIPISTIAACKISMDINSIVQIEKAHYFKLDSLCNLDENNSLYGRLPLRLTYTNNATWEDFFESSFFEELEDDVKNYIQDTFSQMNTKAFFTSNEAVECIANARTEEETYYCYGNYDIDRRVQKTEAIISDEVGAYKSAAHCK